MTVDQYTVEIPAGQCVEIVKGGNVVFKGTIRDLQEYFYTLCQCEIDGKPYQIASTHHITIK